MRRQLVQLAPAPIPILILGETGTGKELCARAISELSGRGPFVPVNCSAVPESLAESEFFGHAKGAFTGADRERGGLIREASGGTLFLDELTEIPQSLQAKLLRVLESGEYRPIGSNQTLMADLRIVAAANSDVAAAVADGALRQDLLYRLGAARVELPALRDRPEDIGCLVESFLGRFARVTGRAVPLRATPTALQALSRHTWPGNVRELRHVLEAAAALARDADELTVDDVYPFMRPGSRASSRPQPISLTAARDRAESEAIQRALRMAGGNRARAAQLLGVSEATLYRKLATPNREDDDVLLKPS